MADNYHRRIVEEDQRRRKGSKNADIFASARKEAARIQDPNARLAFIHFLTDLAQGINKIWEMLRLITPEEFEAPEPEEFELGDFIEESRDTISIDRSISTDDEMFTVTVRDVITTRIVMREQTGDRRIALTFTGQQGYTSS